MQRRALNSRFSSRPRFPPKPIAYSRFPVSKIRVSAVVGNCRSSRAAIRAGGSSSSSTCRSGADAHHFSSNSSETGTVTTGGVRTAEPIVTDGYTAGSSSASTVRCCGVQAAVNQRYWKACAG